MILRKTYRLFEEDERELVYEEVQNEKGQVISFKDYKAPSPYEAFKDYNQDGLLIKESEVVDGVEVSRTEYKYNQEGKILNLKQFVSDELYEETIHEYLSTEMIRISFQFGEEVERMLELKNGNAFIREFFNEGELTHKNHCIYNPETRIEKTEITDHNNELYATVVEQFNSSDHLLKSEKRSAKDQLLSLSILEYENDQLTFEKIDDYEYNEYYEVSHTYDDFNNKVSMEKRTPTGNLLEYHKRTFNNQNQLIHENGYSVGSFSAIYGTYTHGQKYTFKHEYEVQTESQ